MKNIIYIFIFIIIFIIILYFSVINNINNEIILPNNTTIDKYYNNYNINLSKVKNKFKNLQTPYAKNVSIYIFNDDNGIWPEWYKKEEIICNMCIDMSKNICYSLNNPNDYNIIKKVSEDLIDRIKTKIDVGIWGKNWYPFAVCIPLFLTYYLICINDNNYTKKCINLIKKLIKNPRSVLENKKINGVNSVYVFSPIVIANYLDGVDMESLLKSEDYIYVVIYLQLYYKRVFMKDGLHIDNSFFFHDGLPTYSYITSLDTMYANFIDDLIDVNINVFKIIKDLNNIYKHPTIYRMVPLLHRKNNFNLSTNSTSKYGISIHPFMKYLRYFNKDYRFDVKFNDVKIPYYESFEMEIINGLLYSLQYRGLVDKNRDINFKFPEIGFCCPSDTTDLINVVPSSSLKTTELHYLTSGKSFVFNYNNVAFMYQEYSVKYLDDIIMKELIIINDNKHIIDLYFECDNTSNKDYCYYGVNKNKLKDISLIKFIIPKQTKKTFHTNYNIKMNHNSNTEELTSHILEIREKVYPYKLNIKEFDEYCIIYINDNPKYLSTKNISYESNVLNHENLLFYFDKLTNQYKYYKSL